MTLLDWKVKRRSLSIAIRIILRSEGRGCVTEADCRAWATAFIRRYEADWQPGDQLDPEKARLIGGSFERTVSRARRRLNLKRGQWS